MVLPISRHRRQLVGEREIGNDTSQVGDAHVCGRDVVGREGGVAMEQPCCQPVVTVFGLLAKEETPSPAKVVGLRQAARTIPTWIEPETLCGVGKGKRLYIMLSSSTQKTLLCICKFFFFFFPFLLFLLAYLASAVVFFQIVSFCFFCFLWPRKFIDVVFPSFSWSSN